MKVLKVFSLAVLFILLFTARSNAQKSVILQHQGDASVYPSIATALAASDNGDTLYISGGLFTENPVISKNLIIFGAGHYPDSTGATGVTQINGNIVVNGVSGSGYIEGLYAGYIELKGSFSNFTITHCNLNWVKCTTGPVNNVLISENVIRGYIDLGSISDNIIVEKNIIQNRIVNFNATSLSIRNNIFLYTPGTGYRVIDNVFSAIIQNNIFTLTNSLLLDGLTDNTYLNNIIVYNFIGLDASNIVNVDPSTIFVDQSGVLFDYAQDYHLKAGSPAIGFGTDGTDAGIYGTDTPYKTAAVPSNPHISVADVAGATDADQKLQVRFVVTGQSN